MADVIKTQFDIMVSGLGDYARYAEVTERVARAQLRVLSATNQLNPAAVRLTNTYIRLNAEGHKVSTSTTRVAGRLVEVANTVDTTTSRLDRGATAVRNYGISWHGISRIIVGSLISKAISKISMAFHEGVENADNFLLRIGEIRTISQDVPQNFATWSSEVRKLSDAFGTDILETAEGAYQTLSNQIAKGAEVSLFMRDAQEFALISVSTTAEAVQLLSGALNAYNLEASEAGRVSASFFKTIELGRLRSQDIANTFGRVAIIGNQLGVELEELQASLATLTIKGVQPAEAMTFLRNVLLKLIRPTSHMKKIFAEWGVESGAAAIRTFGFVGVLRKLAERAEASGDGLTEIGEAFGRIRAIMGAAGLIGAFDTFEKNLIAIKNSAGDADVALKEMQNNIGFRMRREMQQIKNFFIVDFGGGILKTLDKINIKLEATFGLDFSGFFIAAVPHVLALSVSIAVVTASVVALRYAMVTLASHPIIAAFFAGYTISTFIIKLSEASDAVGAFNDKATASFAASAAARVRIHKESVSKIIEATSNQVNEQIDKTSKFLAYLRAMYNQALGLANIQRDIEDQVLEKRVELANPTQKLYLLQKAIAEETDKFNKSLGSAKTKEEYAAQAKHLTKIDGLLAKIAEIDASFRAPDGSIWTGKQIAVARNTLGLWEKLEDISKSLVNFTDLHDVKLAANLAQIKKLETAHTTLNQTILNNAKSYADMEDKYFKMQEQAIQAKQKFAEVGPITPKYMPTYYPSLANFGPNLSDVPTDAEAKTIALAQKIDEARKVIGELLSLGGTKTLDQIMQMREAAIILSNSAKDLQAYDKNSEYLKEIELFSTLVTIIANKQREMLIQKSQFEVYEGRLSNLNVLMQSFAEKLYFLNGANTIGLETNIKHVDFINQSIPAVQAAIEDTIRRMKVLAEEANRSVEAMRAADAAAMTRQATGGVVNRFASGGSVGGDTVLARLSPGEFVFDKLATRKMLPQLISGNSNSLRTGGSVTNVGDVNLNITNSNATTEGEARQLASAVRRQLRRGNVRLT